MKANWQAWPERHPRIMLSVAATLNVGVVSVVYLRPHWGGAYLMLFLANAASSATPYFTAPGQVATVLAGKSMNVVLVALVAGAGAMVGEVPMYWLGRSGEGLLPAKLREQVVKLKASRMFRWIQKRTGLGIVVLSAIPNPVFDPMSIIVGIQRYAFVKYVLLTLVGKSMRAAVLAASGRMLAG